MLSDTLTPEDRLLIVRSSEGSAELVKPLAEKGLNFDDVHIYEPVYSTGEKIDDDYAVFASAGGVRSFFPWRRKLIREYKVYLHRRSDGGRA